MTHAPTNSRLEQAYPALHQHSSLDWNQAQQRQQAEQEKEYADDFRAQDLSPARCSVSVYFSLPLYSSISLAYYTPIRLFAQMFYFGDQGRL